MKAAKRGVEVRVDWDWEIARSRDISVHVVEAGLYAYQDRHAHATLQLDA